ncbi:hypothetical protein [Xenorhabdus bovienii]|uniref:Uncharacterized protein n=1 Tax=Xenorhabdus bovienii TaxID=40576 RepID=A0A0B6XGP0_XENBV|nr:hypothetical protein [Xenorhabdus bovienii]CDM92134.1 protein of unknown function [Xenorhabdus bovienii]
MNTEQEPTIIVNGVELNSAQAMAIRNTVSSFLSYLGENGLDDDELGKVISASYQDRLREVQEIMFLHCSSKS